MHNIVFIIRIPFVFTLKRVSQRKFPFPFDSQEGTFAVQEKGQAEWFRKSTYSQ